MSLLDIFLKSPYQVDPEKYSRFHQKNICFARAGWDESFKSYGKSIGQNAPAKVRREIPGYSRIEYAMQAASWTVYDTFPGAFSWRRIGDLDADVGPVNRTEDPLTAALGKYEPDDPADLTLAVKRAAQVFGAVDAGVTMVKSEWIYSHRISGDVLDLPQGVDRAVVMVIEMDDFGIGTSPSVPSAVATGSGYSRMAFATACLAEFLRNLGWRAVASGNDTGLSVPLAIDAGLGELGRNGLLIHPVLGQRVRICKVFTDAPLTVDEPIEFGAKRFCLTCKRCAEACPSKSIPLDTEPTWESPHGTPSNNPGVLKWYVNVDSCYAYWTANTVECSNCLRVCPYTKNPGFIHAIPRFFIRRLPWANRLWVWIDALLGYGRQRNPARFIEMRDYMGKRRFLG
jgi:reductive dehalogenase